MISSCVAPLLSIPSLQDNNGQFPINGGLWIPPRFAYLAASPPWRGREPKLTPSGAPDTMTHLTTPISNGPAGLTRPKISFEFFPPKTEEMDKTLWASIERL